VDVATASLGMTARLHPLLHEPGVFRRQVPWAPAPPPPLCPSRLRSPLLWVVVLQIQAVLPLVLGHGSLELQADTHFALARACLARRGKDQGTALPALDVPYI
jgi:hypothetical protein